MGFFDTVGKIGKALFSPVKTFLDFFRDDEEEDKIKAPSVPDLIQPSPTQDFEVQTMSRSEEELRSEVRLRTFKSVQREGSKRKILAKEKELKELAIDRGTTFESFLPFSDPRRKKAKGLGNIGVAREQLTNTLEKSVVATVRMGSDLLINQFKKFDEQVGVEAGFSKKAKINLKDEADEMSKDLKAFDAENSVIRDKFSSKTARIVSTGLTQLLAIVGGGAPAILAQTIAEASPDYEDCISGGNSRSVCLRGAGTSIAMTYMMEMLVIGKWLGKTRVGNLVPGALKKTTGNLGKISKAFQPGLKSTPLARFAKKSISTAFLTGRAAIFEGVQENVEDMTRNAIRKFGWDKSKKVLSWSWETFFTAAVTGGAGAISSVIVGTTENQKAELETIVKDRFIEKGMDAEDATLISKAYPEVFNEKMQQIGKSVLPQRTENQTLQNATDKVAIENDKPTSMMTKAVFDSQVMQEADNQGQKQGDIGLETSVPAQINVGKVQISQAIQTIQDTKRITVEAFDEVKNSAEALLSENSEIRGKLGEDVVNRLSEELSIADNREELLEPLREISNVLDPTALEGVSALKPEKKKVLHPIDAESLTQRRTVIRSIAKQFALSDSELKAINKRDIRIMTAEEFRGFVDDIRLKSEKIQTRRVSLDKLNQQIIDKDLNIENLRKAKKLPTIKNMTVQQIDQINEDIKPFQEGDEFLSPRKLQVVDRTELKGIKTWREARERLAKKLNVPLEDLQNMKVTEFDRFRFDTALAEKNEFYRMMVEETAARTLTSEAEFLELEKKTFKIVRKIKRKGIKQKLVPTFENIIEYMETPVEERDQLNLSDPEIELAEFMTKEFSDARDYLIQIGAMKIGKEDYFVHIRRGFLEALLDGGFKNAAKEMFTSYKQDQQNFNILDQQTGEILAMDKFFKFAMHRTGDLKPTQNVVKAFLAYMQTFKKKQALDEIIPLIDIYATSITPPGLTEKGVRLHGNLIKFVKEWLNTKKGRHVTLIAKQGGKIDIALKALKSFVVIKDLGLNIGTSVAAQFGEQITTFQLLGNRNFIKGKARALTKQGKKILKENEAFIGKNPWAQLVEPAKDIGDRLNEGLFILFRDATVRGKKTFLLGSLTKEEFKSGKLDPERLASLRTEAGRYKPLEGAKSVIGATPEGGAQTMYKTWAIPILRTNLNNLNNITMKVFSKNVSKKEKLKSLRETMRLVESTLIVMMVRGMIPDDEDDKSFGGKLLNKAYRDAMSLVSAMNPAMFLTVGRLASFVEDFGLALELIIKGETYKTGEKAGTSKGIGALKRLVKPAAITQFEGGDKEPSKSEGTPQERARSQALSKRVQTSSSSRAKNLARSQALEKRR